jgi:hypothetical protein
MTDMLASKLRHTTYFHSYRQLQIAVMAQTLYMACSRYHADIIDQRAVIAENTQQRQ